MASIDVPKAAQLAATLLAGSLSLSACTAFAPRESPLENVEGKTMMQIFADHEAGLDPPASPKKQPESAELAQAATQKPKEPRDRLPLRAPDDDAYVGQRRDLSQPLDNRFVRIPNPDLVMFVYPHLSANGKYPIPGYATMFPMYREVHYALPGEVAPREYPSADRPQ